MLTDTFATDDGGRRALLILLLIFRFFDDFKYAVGRRRRVGNELDVLDLVPLARGNYLKTAG